MEPQLPDLQPKYEALVEALRMFREHSVQPTARAIMDLQYAVARVTEAWEHGAAQRTPREKEMRYHVVRLKLLLASVQHALEVLDDMRLPKVT